MPELTVKPLLPRAPAEPVRMGKARTTTSLAPVAIACGQVRLAIGVPLPYGKSPTTSRYGPRTHVFLTASGSRARSAASAAFGKTSSVGDASAEAEGEVLAMLSVALADGLGAEPPEAAKAKAPARIRAMTTRPPIKHRDATVARWLGDRTRVGRGHPKRGAELLDEGTAVRVARGGILGHAPGDDPVGLDSQARDP